VSVSELAAATFVPSALKSIGPDLLVPIGTHRHWALHVSPLSQPVELPSHSSSLPESTTPSPHSEVTELNSSVSPPGVFTVPAIAEQLFVISAVSLTLPL